MVPEDYALPGGSGLQHWTCHQSYSVYQSYMPLMEGRWLWGETVAKYFLPTNGFIPQPY